MSTPDEIDPSQGEPTDDLIFPLDPIEGGELRAGAVERMTGPVIGVIKVKIASQDAALLGAECGAVLASESRELPGFVAAQILASVDQKIIVILTEWTDHHAWSQSRYDERVGAMIERLYDKSMTMEFETYTRSVEFARGQRAP